jgi:hypothetical protein
MRRSPTGFRNISKVISSVIADAPEGLVALQTQSWDPLLACDALGAHYVLI